MSGDRSDEVLREYGAASKNRHRPPGVWWVDSATIRNHTAFVEFGGDTDMIGSRSGTSGAEAWERTIYYTLTAIPGVWRVHTPDLGEHWPGGGNDTYWDSLPAIEPVAPPPARLLRNACDISVTPDPFNPATAPGGVLRLLGVPSGAYVQIRSRWHEGEWSRRGFTGGSLEWNGKSNRGLDMTPGLCDWWVEGPKESCWGTFTLIRASDRTATVFGVSTSSTSMTGR